MFQPRSPSAVNIHDDAEELSVVFLDKTPPGPQSRMYSILGGGGGLCGASRLSTVPKCVISVLYDVLWLVSGRHGQCLSSCCSVHIPCISLEALKSVNWYSSLLLSQPVLVYHIGDPDYLVRSCRAAY